MIVHVDLIQPLHWIQPLDLIDQMGSASTYKTWQERFHIDEENWENTRKKTNQNLRFPSTAIL